MKTLKKQGFPWETTKNALDSKAKPESSASANSATSAKRFCRIFIDNAKVFLQEGESRFRTEKGVGVVFRGGPFDRPWQARGAG